MLNVAVALLVAVVVVGLVVPLVFLFLQKEYYERKSYERGLKMVTLLIHLPPPSEDIQNNGRDTRDVLEENISRAQIIYNIIASTYRKNFKDRLYGQRHFAFEIVGARGFVYFYIEVPFVLIDVVKQAVVSAYPSARLEQVEDKNIFNPAGKIAGTLGGEMSLKEPYGYPISTYQELKRDALQGLLNALANLDKEDGVGIQILIRPAHPSWRKTASAIALHKRKGDNGKKGFGKIAKFVAQLATAFIKPPSDHSQENSNGHELSGLDQSILDSIDDKTRYSGYEVFIRIIVSSNLTQRSQAILNNIVAAFALFDAPGKNGFKFTPSKNTQELVVSYIMRFFPRNAKKMILNSVELATLFHFPDQSNIPTSQLGRQDSKQVDGPRNVPDQGLLLGYNLFRGAKKPIRLALTDRQRHMYAVGQTGTGKSTFLENLALQDMLNGDGFAFVDPHGDTAERLLAMVPRERTEDVIYFCPSEMDYPMGLNLFEFQNVDQKDFLIQEALNMLYKLYDPQHQGIMGPRYEHLFRNAALTVMADPSGGTFIDIPKLFRDPAFVKQKLQYVTDPNVVEFWQKEMPVSQRSNEFGEVVSWFVSKFGAFLSNEMMRRIIGQTKSAFDLREVMDNGKILLVNLSKGRTGELNSKLLGMVFVMKFQAAAMSRANIPESERKDFALYVDEFQNFSTDSFATIMSEARKYHLNLIVANQFTTQLTDEIRDAVFGNMGTIVSFRVGQNDVDILAKYFQPVFEADDLLRVPNYNTITRTLIGGIPTQAFSMATLPPLGTPNEQLAKALKQLSAVKYGKPKVVVENDINARLTTKPVTAGSSVFGSVPNSLDKIMPASTGDWNGPGIATGRVSKPSIDAGFSGGPPSSSFLDEWLAKRHQAMSRGVNKTNQAPLTNKDQPSSGAVRPQASTSGSNPVVIGSSEPPLFKSANEPAEFNRPDTEEDTIYIDREGNMHNNDQVPSS